MQGLRGDEKLAILQPHDYINFYLTGRLVMECGDASGTGEGDRTASCSCILLDFLNT